MDDKEFIGRTALVTGGSRGIGRAICQKLGQCGARVAINYVANQRAAEEVCQAIRAAGGSSTIYQADVSDPDQTSDMFDTVEKDLGPVDLLVTNAGIARSADSISMTAETWQEIMRTNLDGTFHQVWRAKDGMITRGYGRIVCISSILGLMVNPISPARQIAYGTSKAAIFGFVRNCAAAFGPHVRVNSVAPGFIETDLTADITDKARETLIESTPLKRTGDTCEIAELVCFLLSDKSSFTTGQTHVASGGMGTLP
ncbi:MAG: 3-oxoacyl-ACP reductase family protein [Pseudomonadota bacterium]|nr:3-oxoacyl-ACP reductase family protein [Pseudomonadota bacterium]